MAEDSLRIAGYASDNVGSGNYRLINPIRALGDLGHETTWTMSWTEFLHLAQDADVLLLQRLTLEAAPLIKQWRQTKLVICEIDDLLHAIPPENPTFYQYKAGSPLLKNFTANLVEADGVIASSWELWRYYQRFNRNIVIVPNFIDFDYRDWDTPFPKNGDRLVVGWSGGSQHHPEAPFIAEILQWVLQQYKHVDVALYCHPQFAMDIISHMSGVSPARIIHLPVRPFEDYPFQLGFFDIGIAPVANIDFNRAKCLDASTIVWTPLGMRQVGELSAGDWVWNGSRFVHVVAVQEEGESLGVDVLLECGLSLQMTYDHRVLTDIGWLHAGKLRVGDKLQLAQPRYIVRETMTDPVKVARVLAYRYTPAKSSLRNDEVCTRGLAELGDCPIRPLFAGWSDLEIARFLNEFLSIAGQDVEYGTVRKVTVFSAELLQCLAEFALFLGRRCRLAKSAARSQRTFHLLFERGKPDEFSRIIRIRSCWLKAVDIQVEGEVFCANGVLSHNSSLKPLEYMARGVVPVVSDIAEYRLLAKRGAPVLLANHLSDWQRHIRRLVEDPEYRASLDGRSWVREHANLHSESVRYVEAIQQIADWKRSGRPKRGEAWKLERHHPCPCGSGKKYSKCCYPAFGV